MFERSQVLPINEAFFSGNGVICFDEFLGMMAKKVKHSDRVSEIKEAFKVLDRDNDGFITAQELKVHILSRTVFAI